MQLATGIQAPLFNTKDAYGRIIDLATFQNKKVLIGFFRHAGCPFCNLRVHTLMKHSRALKEKNLEMIFFFESKESVLLRSSFHKEISPIPLISDPEKKWYNTYGLEPSPTKSAISHLTSFVQTAYRAYRADVPIHMMADGESISTMPAEFLIDEGLIIREVHYSERLNDRMSLDRIFSFVSRRID